MCTMRLRNNFHLVAKGWVCGSNYLLSKALEFVIRVEQSHGTGHRRPLTIYCSLWAVVGCLLRVIMDTRTVHSTDCIFDSSRTNGRSFWAKGRNPRGICYLIPSLVIFIPYLNVKYSLRHNICKPIKT
jgi:hypothetical protein